MSDQRKNKSRSPGPTREKLSESDRLARALRKHFDRAAAEAIWCVRHVQESIRSGQCAPTVDVKSLCGEHWQPMWKEWRAVARLCRRQAEIERRTGHPVVLAILSVVADKLTRPGNPIKALSDAIELLTWLPSPSISVRNPQAEALEEIARYPVLDWPAKADVLKQIRTKHGRPRTTRAPTHNAGTSGTSPRIAWGW